MHNNAVRALSVPCRTTTKGHIWHSSLMPFPTIPFSYKAWVWVTRQMSIHRHRLSMYRQRMIIVYLSSTTIDWLSLQAIFDKLFNLLCSRLLCKWYSWKRHKEAMSVVCFCRGMVVDEGSNSTECENWIKR